MEDGGGAMMLPLNEGVSKVNVELRLGEPPLTYPQAFYVHVQFFFGFFFGKNAFCC